MRITGGRADRSRRCQHRFLPAISGSAVAELKAAAAELKVPAAASLCVPTSLAQEVGSALGAQAGEARLREVATAAGFDHFRRATETPFNMILEARS